MVVCPQGYLLTVGNEILEATVSYRCGHLSIFVGTIIKNYCNKDPNMRHKSAPNRLTNEDYRKDYLSDKIGVKD